MRILLTGVSAQVGGALLPRLGAMRCSRPTGPCSISRDRIGATLDRLAPE